MALIKCPDCGTEMSDQAKTCPKCGRTRATKADKITLFIVTMIIVLIVGGAIAFWINMV